MEYKVLFIVLISLSCGLQAHKRRTSDKKQRNEVHYLQHRVEQLQALAESTRQRTNQQKDNLSRRVQELTLDNNRLQSRVSVQNKITRIALKSFVVLEAAAIGAMAQLLYCKSQSLPNDSVLCAESPYLGTLTAGFAVSTAMMLQGCFRKKHN